jgi:hypothetical protein
MTQPGLRGQWQPGLISNFKSRISNDPMGERRRTADDHDALNRRDDPVVNPRMRVATDLSRRPVQARPDYQFKTGE